MKLVRLTRGGSNRTRLAVRYERLPHLGLDRYAVVNAHQTQPQYSSRPRLLLQKNMFLGFFSGVCDDDQSAERPRL